MAEVRRIFAPHPRQGVRVPGAIYPPILHGVGTPELRELLAEHLGVSDVDEEQLSSFLLSLVERPDSSPDPDVRSEQKALVAGACAWLFAPMPQSSFVQLLSRKSEGEVPENSPRQVNRLEVRKAWAYSQYKTTQTGAKQLLVGSSKSGDNFRTKFRDALMRAIVRYLDEDVGPSASGGDGNPPEPADRSAPSAEAKVRILSALESPVRQAKLPKPFPRRIVNLVLFCSILISAAIIGVWLFSSSKPTEIATYVPTAVAYAEARNVAEGEDVPVTCAQSSLASLRMDARLCLRAGLVLDPCFDIEVDLGHVVCPQVMGDYIAELGVYKVLKILPFTFDASQVQQQVGVERAQSQPYPWAILLAQKDAKGLPFVCEMSWSGTRFEPGYYNCNSTERPQVHIVGTGDAEIAEIRGITIMGPGTLSAGPLDLSGPVATIVLADPVTGKLETVRVVAAWY